MRASNIMGDQYEMSHTQLIATLDAALEGVRARGKAQPGEKTMLDTLTPAVAALKAAQEREEPFLAACDQALAAAEEGMKATIPMLATKGRASYLGERSIGHQDPGATSSFYIAQVLAETLKDIDNSRL
jgi:dihydroxyacetone kinase-like protein